MRDQDGRHANFLDRYATIAKALPTNSSVLDIGCGDGSFLRYLENARPDCKLTGADISRNAIDRLNESAITAIHLSERRRLAEQLCKGSYDVIVLMEIIEHIQNAEDFVKQAVELEPKLMFITIPNVGFIIHRLRLMFGGRFPVTSVFYHMREHVRFWTVRDFEQWAPTVGLKLICYQPHLMDPNSKLAWFISRAPKLMAKQMVYTLTPCGMLGPTGRRK